MKNKKLLKILFAVLIVVMFVALIVTSVLINNKKDDINNIPNVESYIECVKKA